MPLLPGDASAGAAATPDGMHSLATALTTRLAPTDGPRPLHVIVDVHELDATSAAVVAQALAGERVAVLASARTGAAVPDVLMAYWRSGRAVAIFFFSSRRRHTRCLSDWSSDVCSSD